MDVLPVISTLLNEFPMQTFTIPDLWLLLNQKSRPFPFRKSYEESRNDLIFILHTSGSTGKILSAHESLWQSIDYLGFPKALTYTHEYVTYSVGISQLLPPQAHESFNAAHHNKRIFSPSVFSRMLSRFTTLLGVNTRSINRLPVYTSV